MWSRWQQLPRFVLAGFIACGVATVWCFAIAMLADAILERLFGRRETEALLVGADAVVIKSLVNRRDGPVITYRFPDGRPVPLSDVEKWETGFWLSPSSFSGPLHEDVSFVSPGWDRRLDWFWFSGRDKSRWYHIHDGLAEGHTYFVGYELETKSLLGYLGKNGFVAVPPPKEHQFPFDGRRLMRSSLVSTVISATNTVRYDAVTQTSERANLPDWVVYLLSGDELWRVDLRHHTVARLGRFPGAIDLKLAPLPAGTFDAPGKIVEKLMLRTDAEMVQVSLEGKVLRRWPIPEQARAQEFLYWYDLGDDRALVRFTRRTINRHLEEDLTWLDADGGIQRRETVEVLQGGLEPREVGMFTAAMPMPTVLTFMLCAISGEVRGPDYASGFAKTLALFWPGLVLVYVISATLAGFAYRRQFRFALPRAGGWAVFVFLLGVPGWLAYRWHRHWPVLAECGECHRPAPRDRETCAACGHLFATPPLVGTEVFA